MKFEAVVFDFDGLMIESESIALRVWKQVTADFGGAMEDALNLLIIGKSPDAAARIVQQQLGISVSPDELKRTYWQQRTVAMSQEAKPVEGLEDLIQELVGKNIRLAVASNSPSQYLERVLEAIQLRSYMECVVSSDQVHAGKPAPDVYLSALRLLASQPGESLALEDSPTGVQAAVQAGMTCYAIPNPDLGGEDFSQAHRQFGSMPELHTFLQDEGQI